MRLLIESAIIFFGTLLAAALVVLGIPAIVELLPLGIPAILELLTTQDPPQGGQAIAQVVAFAEPRATQGAIRLRPGC